MVFLTICKDIILQKYIVFKISTIKGKESNEAEYLPMHKFKYIFFSEKDK